MSPGPDKIAEMDLQAYVDGELAPADRGRVEQQIVEDARLAERVGELQSQNAALIALYGYVAEEPIPGRLDLHTIKRQRAHSQSHWSRIAAAALLLVGLGGTAGWFGRDLTLPVATGAVSLIDEAIAAHRVFTSEVLHPVEVRADERDHLAAWLSRRLGRALVVPDLRSKDLDLVGGRLLPSAAGPAAQLMYENKAGHRITLFIVAEATGEEVTLRSTTLDQLEAVFWTDKAISCAIIGDLPRSELSTIAQQAYEQLG